MSFKHVLGTMLASRMAGRGAGRGMMGSAAMMAMMGRGKRGVFGGKAGLAGMAFMAYQAYQSNQARSAQSPKLTKGTTADEGLGGVLKDLAGRFGFVDSDPAETAARQAPDPEAERAAAALSDEEALLLIRAMITAAHSDGSISPDERAHILQQIDAAGVDKHVRRTVEQEIENPRPLDELLAQVRGPEMAQQFYLASRAAMDRVSEVQRTYLVNLREQLNLTSAEVGEIERFAS